jgi:hypothetical protein
MHEEQRFWETVMTTAKNMREKAPDGYAPKVQVHAAGEKFAPEVVQYREPWLFFEMGDEPMDSPTRRVLAVRPEFIAKVEITFVETKEKQPPGFRVGDVTGESE